MSLGENIVALRKKRGLTQEKLAEVFEVSRQSVTKWESGECIPNIELVCRIAEYFNISNNFKITIDDLEITFYNNESHSIESYMVKIQNTNFKIIYTSDIGTTNFDELINFCKNSDLIICESSFLKKHNSNCKTHMTAYDAGVLAKKSNSKQLLLTHFWPEEDKKLYLEEAKPIFKNVVVAEEGKMLVL